jgi:hypothetical protein
VAKSEGAMLSVTGPDKDMFQGLKVTHKGTKTKLCPLTVDNSKVIRKLFDFTNPKSHKGFSVTLGLGDRLGIATPGHIQAVRDLDVFPVLAQQSMRELDLTGRMYDDVLAAAVWAVFREGYEKGYGADGDHLKTHDEVKHALSYGYTMITLDCSEHIRNDFTDMPQTEVNGHYAALQKDVTTMLEKKYLNKSFPIGNNAKIEFDEADFRRIVLIYLPAINHALNIYEELIKDTDIDFEISIDETISTTTPQSHYFVANELIKQGVEISSLAPRFVGEFQKGIDYIGDTQEFEQNFLDHARIAENFGYKLSVHSGSDKFAIFPIVGRLSGGRYHLKTAGTSWLEAVRIIALYAPGLYREIHTFALKNLHEAKKYYHITENVANIAALESISDSMLAGYLKQSDSRRILHITYGLILTAKTQNGTPLFRDRIYQALQTHESEYSTALEKHITNHLKALGVIY